MNSSPISDASGLAPILDRQQLAVLIDYTDPETLHMVLEMFFTEAVRYAEELHAVDETADLARLRGLAHNFKSSARQVGAARLADALGELEDACKRNAGGRVVILVRECLERLAATRQVYREQGIWND